VAGETELQDLIEGGVPEEALRFFARWWQFETYLREVVYLELRARDGAGYETAIGSRTLSRARRDEENDYMASADRDPLAYMDAGQLLELIEENWVLFEPTLLPLDRWAAAASLIKALRNRVSHCRRPHGDDLGRLRQLLRDLEHGAERFYASVAAADLEVSPRDPLGKLWVKGRHPTAARLIEHAERRYDTRFYLHASRRPWAEDGSTITGSEGFLFHANWILGGRELRLPRLWRSIEERGATARWIVHLLMPNPFHAMATFAAVDPIESVADAIGAIFDSILETSVEMQTGIDVKDGWADAARDLPSKVQTYSPLSLFDPYHPFSIFRA
jgi:hypothetical protein